ncbi:hypothetical protein IMZ31_19300 (plasmid) [Pontibacillus sp. ALD_SL1]|uniref:DNA translocase FtsK n=1 Tax=Pontibacillus sp. ALD_SL1 TaxID=2777185 RepID=UPI001A971F09|nr:DNA translocase FtsK [Pontibacillus sp. ALD_SL1]QST02697.1 hypothetical protein IMZ31_19300 [Pontibacillus sp. ALD_SL1]
MLIPVFAEVNKGQVYTYTKEKGKKKPSTFHAYLSYQKALADKYYERIVDLTRGNGSASIVWIKKQFPLGYHGAAYAVDRMREEGILGNHDRELGHSRVIV